MNSEALTKGILTKEQQAEGLSLWEEDGTIYLVRKGKVLAPPFPTREVKIETLRNEAEQVLQSIKSGITVERVG